MSQEPATDSDVSEADLDRLLKMFRGMANAHRFEVLRFIMANPHCQCSEVVEFLPLSQATVSVHLKVLRESGWTRGKRVGLTRVHQADYDNIDWFQQMLAKVFSA